MEISSAKIAEMVKKVLADMEGGANASAEHGLVPSAYQQTYTSDESGPAVLFGEGANYP
ncbi:MAG: hypothetical protein ACLRSW_07185 [Christensenellaceae bacterium]